MYCSKCGNELRSTDMFCSNCGTQVNQEKSVNDQNGIVGDSGGTEPEKSILITHDEKSSTASESVYDKDPLFVESARLVISNNKASIGMIQRGLKIGFNRAARIMDQLQEAGIVGEENGTKPREVLVTMEELGSNCNRCGIPISSINIEDKKTVEKSKHKHFTIAWCIGSLLIVRLLGGTLFDSFLLGMLGSLVFRYVFKKEK